MKLSALDLISSVENKSTNEMFKQTIDLAKRLDEIGYKRLWFAEHHGSEFQLSSAPEISATYMSGQTDKISVGTGGTMIMHYSPLKIAETFKTMAALTPGRVDLGLGRAPGGSHVAIKALGEGKEFHPTDLYDKIKTILQYLTDEERSESLYNRIDALPKNLEVLPMPWLLGSSGNSAMKAGEMGVGYTFAKFFGIEGVPDDIFEYYRSHFEPSTFLKEPYGISTYQIVVAETKEEADELAKPLEINRYQMATGRISGILTVESAKEVEITQQMEAVIDHQYQERFLIKGTPEEVKDILLEEQEKYGFDEAMVYSPISDHEKRLKSYELLYQAFNN